MLKNTKVAIRIRPLIQREKKAKKEEVWKDAVNSIHSVNVNHPCHFTFDNIFGPDCRNSDVYSIVDPIVKMALNGFNGTIFLYGQTTSGKTHTMLGTEEDLGIIYLAFRQLFDGQERELSIRVGYIEIFREKAYDLLNDRNAINFDSDKLSNAEVPADNLESITEIFHHGNRLRKSSLTADQNKFSSRSHAIFQITIESIDKTQVSHLNFIHLAGSELVSDIDKEGHHVNKGLLWLNLVINGLCDGEKGIDYRNSSLTHILKESLGGNCNTAFICNVTPTALNETISTLNFANQARKVQNKALCNVVHNDDRVYSAVKLESQVINMEQHVQPNVDHHSTLSDFRYIDLGALPHAKTPLNSPSHGLLMKRGLVLDKEPQEKRSKKMSMSSTSSYHDQTVSRSSGNQMKRGLLLDKEPQEKRSKTMSTTSTSSSHDQTESRSFSSISEGSENLALELQLKEIVNCKAENFRLVNELQLMKSAHENDRKYYNEQIKSAQLAHQKAEFLRVKAELTIKELIKQVEEYKAKLNCKINSDNLENNLDLQTQLQTLEKSNAALQLTSRRLQNENLLLKNKNQYLSKKMQYRKNISSRTVATTEHKADIKNKIKRLEDVVSNEIRMLKEELDKNRETTPSTSSGPNLTATIIRSMTIPNTLVGCVIGTGGTILKNIYQMSGAKIAVSPRDGNNDRTVNITGSPQCVASAMDMIRNNINQQKDLRRRRSIKLII